jgi:hypothetical protein
VPKKEQIIFEVDPFNRLVYRKTGKESGVKQFRSVLEGEFQVSQDNLITYRLKNPVSSGPQQFKLSGNWSLDDNYNLVLTLDKENNQRKGNKLTLQSQLIDARADELTFALSTGDSPAREHFYLLKLTGKWQADKYNRLSFLVSKENSAPDTLTLCTAWEINQQNELVYTYIKTGLKRKDKLTRTLTFKGFWDIAEKKRICYVLNRQIGSAFDFQISAARPAPKGLEYEIGFGASPAKKKFLLFGSWKISEKLGLIFEMPAGGRKIQRIIFGASCRLAKGHLLELKLKNSRQENLGIAVHLARTFLKGLGQAYVQALKDGQELSLVAGVGIKW